MIHVTTASLVLLAAGFLTSVSVLSAYQVLFTIVAAYFTYIKLKEGVPRLPKSAYFLLAFTSVALITTVINFEYLPSPSKNFGRLKYFIYGVTGIYVFAAWFQAASVVTKKNVLRVFFLSAIVAGSISCWQVLVLKEWRATGLTHTLRYGYGSAMYLVVLLGLLLHHKKVEKWFDFKSGLVAFVIGFLAFYMTYTRGALLGFLCALPFSLIFFRRKLGLLLGGVSILVVLTLGGFYLFGSGKYNSRFLVNKNNYADVIRRSQWKAAALATWERPVLGWGLSNFHTQLKRIKHQYDLDAKEYDDAHSHNVFLEVSSGTGLVGLFLFLGWIICWAIESFKGNELIRALIVPFGVAFVVSSQFEVTLDANNASLIFTLYSISTAVNWKGFEKDSLR